MWVKILIATLVAVVLLATIVSASVVVVRNQRSTAVVAVDAPLPSVTISPGATSESTAMVVYSKPEASKAEVVDAAASASPKMATGCSYRMVEPDHSSDIVVADSPVVAELSDGSMTYPEVTSTDLFFTETESAVVPRDSTNEDQMSGYELGHVGVGTGPVDNYTFLTSEAVARAAPAHALGQGGASVDSVPDYTILPADHYSGSRNVGGYVPSYRDSFPTLPKLSDGKLSPSMKKEFCACDTVSEHEYTRTPSFSTSSEGVIRDPAYDHIRE